MRLDLELPEGPLALEIAPGEAHDSLAAILRRQNLPLNTRCGERDLCSGCTVELLSGEVARLDDGTSIAAEHDAVPINACRYRAVRAGVRVRIPQRSLLAYAPQVVGDYRIDVPVARDPLVTTGLGACVDIGTTTVVVQLVDPTTGEVKGKAAAFNAQMHLGDDVLTRINRVATHADGLGELHRAILLETLTPLVTQALAEANATEADLGAWVLSGNTTMLHLVLGEDPSSLGHVPFRPVFLEVQQRTAAQVGLPGGTIPVVTLPGAAAYVGADIVAGVAATGLAYEDRPAMLVDVGTNGEMVLHHDGGLIGCATAAGPAFEGSGLSCGLRAGAGAISRIRLQTDPLSVDIEVIGGGKPTGVCGSAYVDFLAEGHRAGLLTPTGRFDPALREAHPDAFVEADKAWALRVGTAQGRRPITISEVDVALLLQAKAAVAAGVLTLARRFGLTPGQLPRVCLAGGFGMHLDLGHTIACGLLPGLQRDAIELVGNTSLGGATLAFLDRNLLEEMSSIATRIEVIELNTDPEFEMTYIENLSLEPELF